MLNEIFIVKYSSWCFGIIEVKFLDISGSLPTCAYLQACLALFQDTFGRTGIGKLLQIINKKGGLKEAILWIVQS